MLTPPQNSLRRRFSQAYHWYSVLAISAEDYIFRFIHSVPLRDAQTSRLSPVDAGGHRPDSDQLSDPPTNTPTQGDRQVCAIDINPRQLNPNCIYCRTKPSDYLRSRCPLCFGAEIWGRKSHDNEYVIRLTEGLILSFLRPDCIVCVDACFTQKRTHGPRNSMTEDPPNPTDTVFVSVHDVNAMENFVEEKRQVHSRKRKQRSDEGAFDGHEEGMRVPVSALDGCGESFIAADEKRQKASTRFFVDTGLMGLLCRHDRVLWLVNMTSPGERQHYVLVLLLRLFNHLPPTMTVGLLYDIGCQLERSCRKWGLLNDVLSRIKFSISVFHAYGHQWPCQIVYHPRKCVGFGLSDGEGCERLWSSLKFLIPILRVSGVRVFRHLSWQIYLMSTYSIINVYLFSTIRFATWMKNPSWGLVVG